MTVLTHMCILRTITYGTRYPSLYILTVTAADHLKIFI